MGLISVRATAHGSALVASALVLAVAAVSCRDGDRRASGNADLRVDATAALRDGDAPRTYADAREAARDLLDALHADDPAGLGAVLGARAAQRLASADHGGIGLEGLALASRQDATLDHVGVGCVLVRVGLIGFPLPVSIVRRGERWTFGEVVDEQSCSGVSFERTP